MDKDDFDCLRDTVDKDIDRKLGRLSDACGVYLFGVRGLEGKRTTIGQTLPWYVGKAEKQSFRKECFNSKNQTEFNRVWVTRYDRKGVPFVYLLARMEDDGTFSNTTKDK